MCPLGLRCFGFDDAEKGEAANMIDTIVNRQGEQGFVPSQMPDGSAEPNPNKKAV